MRYWIYKDSQILGPVEGEELLHRKDLIDSLVCPEGATGVQESDWRAANEVINAPPGNSAVIVRERSESGTAVVSEEWGDFVRGERPPTLSGEEGSLGSQFHYAATCEIQFKSARREISELQEKLGDLTRKIEQYEERQNMLLERLSEKDKLIDEKQQFIKVLQVEAQQARRAPLPSSWTLEEGLKTRNLSAETSLPVPPAVEENIPTEIGATPSELSQIPSPTRVAGQGEGIVPMGETPGPALPEPSVLAEGRLEAEVWQVQLPVPDTFERPELQEGSNILPAVEKQVPSAVHLKDASMEAPQSQIFNPPAPETPAAVSGTEWAQASVEPLISSPIHAPVAPPVDIPPAIPSLPSPVEINAGEKGSTTSPPAPAAHMAAGAVAPTESVPPTPESIIRGQLPQGEVVHPSPQHWADMSRPVSSEILSEGAIFPLEKKDLPAPADLPPSQTSAAAAAGKGITPLPAALGGYIPPGVPDAVPGAPSQTPAAGEKAPKQGAPGASERPVLRERSSILPAVRQAAKRGPVDLAPRGRSTPAAGIEFVAPARKETAGSKPSLEPSKKKLEMPPIALGIAGVAAAAILALLFFAGPKKTPQSPSENPGPDTQSSSAVVPPAPLQPQQAAPGRDYIADLTPKAIELVKNYPLNRGRQTIARWLQYSFLSVPGNEDEWTAGAQAANSYIVQYLVYRGGRSVDRSPIRYIFEADLTKNAVQGLNQAAKELLAGETGKTVRTASRRTKAPIRRSKPKSKRKKPSKPSKLKKRQADAMLPLPGMPIISQ